MNKFQKGDLVLVGKRCTLYRVRNFYTIDGTTVNYILQNIKKNDIVKKILLWLLHWK